MECPRCGYIMDAFAIECLRCRRMKALGREVRVPARYSGRQQAPVVQYIPGVRRWLLDPAVGWPAFIVLLIICVLCGFQVCWVTLGLVFGLPVQVLIPGCSAEMLQMEQPSAFWYVLRLTLPFAAKYFGALAFLSFKRWGYYLFLAASACAAGLAIHDNMTNPDFINYLLILIFDGIPVLVVYQAGNALLDEMR